MLALVLLITLSIVTLSAMGQLAAGRADLSPAGLVRSVRRGVGVLGTIGDGLHPAAQTRG